MNGHAGVDTIRLGLEASSATWFQRVTWCGYAVAVGCAMEAPEVFSSIRRWWKLRFQDVELEEDKRSLFGPLAAFGLLVIVIGIVLETYCEGRVSDVESELRNHLSEKVTAAEMASAAAIRDAGAASFSATSAASAAKAANSDAITADNKASDAENRIEAAGKKLSSVVSRAKALEQTESALQRGLLLRQDRGNVLDTQPNGEIFWTKMRPFAGQRVEVRYRANSLMPSRPYDEETFWVAFDIFADLSIAKWSSLSPILDEPSDHGTGIFVHVTKGASQRTRDAATALAKALSEIPLEIRPAMQGIALSEGSLVWVNDEIKRRVEQPNGMLLPPFDEDTIVVEVDPHP